jgi:hypothetical protein
LAERPFLIGTQGNETYTSFVIPSVGEKALLVAIVVALFVAALVFRNFWIIASSLLVIPVYYLTADRIRGDGRNR